MDLVIGPCRFYIASVHGYISESEVLLLSQHLENVANQLN